MLCRDAIVVKHEVNRLSARVLTCRSWSCELCRPERQKQLIAKAISGHPTNFITLTVNPATGTDPVDRARALVKAWRTIRKLAMRKYSYKALEFLAVIEATKKGEAHLHILARVKWIDQAWLSEQMERLTGAPIVWIERLDGQKKIANYVAKYCGKEPMRFGTLKRYWTSRNWEQSEWKRERVLLDSKPRIERRAQSMEAFEEGVRALGYEVRFDRQWLIAEKPPPARPVIW